MSTERIRGRIRMDRVPMRMLRFETSGDVLLRASVTEREAAHAKIQEAISWAISEGGHACSPVDDFVNLTTRTSFVLEIKIPISVSVPGWIAQLAASERALNPVQASVDELKERLISEKPAPIFKCDSE